MNALEAIAARRSIRKFKSDPIPEQVVRAILQAAIQAPSGKNRQPWKFILVGEDRRAEMMKVMRMGMARMKAEGEDLDSSEWTARVMDQAPLTVFVINPHGKFPWLAHSIDENFQELVDVQSVGAAIQNMLLAALDLGLGSLWICDVFYAYEELMGWLGEKGQMVAAVSLGYPGEAPAARSRKPFDEVVRRM
jgi:F420 biosynthesis protein FbiB-like protein